MLAFVVPAQNESKTISQVINNLLSFNPDLIVIVVNGCLDSTLSEVQKLKYSQIHILYFEEGLGIDVPRAIGASYAFSFKASRVIFVDGDMAGPILDQIALLDKCLTTNCDMALVNCYPYITCRHPLTNRVLEFRGLLNRALGMYSDLGLANPSHGPHGISRQLFLEIATRELAIPPVSLTLSVLKGLNVKVAAAIPHSILGSDIRGPIHSEIIAETIIGDCIEGLNIINNVFRSRFWEGTNYVGYNSSRRFDLLNFFLKHPNELTVYKS